MKKFRFNRILPFFAFFFLWFVISCAHYERNLQLTSAEERPSYDFEYFNENPGQDNIFVVLTFSGGGTRAASLAYGVLEKLKTVQIPGTDRVLLDEVDLISTVSGGSFTGAYYALFGDRIFRDYKEKFLYRSIEKELLGRIASPINWVRLASPNFNRIDLAAELYHQTIFESNTFETLIVNRKRPFLIINATNLYQGARFEFTGSQFHYLGSDLSSYRVANAVAASSAFPFLLSPIGLVNYPNIEGYKRPQSDTDALEDYRENKRRYYAAVNKIMYEDKAGHPYVFLMDGGLADNIGLRAVADIYIRGGIRKKILAGKIERLLVIVVNARTEPPQDFDKKESPPGLIKVGFKTATLSMDNYSFETVEMFKQMAADRVQTQKTWDSCQEILDQHSRDRFQLDPLAGGKLKLYIADLSFDDLRDETEKQYFKSLPTSFSLKKSQVDRLIQAGGKLLGEDPEFKKFLREF